MWQAWTNGILGVWIFIAAFLSMGTQGNFWNDLIVGVITAVVGFLMVKEKSWQGWLTGIVGIWLIIAAFIPALLVGGGLLWDNIIVGVLLMVGGFGALGGTPHTEAHSH